MLPPAISVPLRTRSYAWERTLGLALWDLRKGRIPRGIQLPSDVLRAKEAYETALRESKIWVNELNRARDLLKQARERVSELREQLDTAGCGT